VELGISAAVTAGDPAPQRWAGQIGAGVAEAPLSCFADATTDLGRRLTEPATAGA
jgi:hypothetical protein